MSYAIDPKAPVQDGLRRVAIEEMEWAIAEALDTSLDHQSAIHQARKRCKRIRALLALFRGALPNRVAESQPFRTLGNALAPLRNADALIEAFDRLETAVDGEAWARLQPIRVALVSHRSNVTESGVGPDRLRRFLAEGMRDACARVPTWRLACEGWAALEPGFVHEYGRARKALEFFGPDASGERVHDLRKAVKRHGCHTLLVEGGSEDRPSARRASLDSLGDLLGDDHDLGILLELSPQLALPRALGDSLESVIGARQAICREQASALADRLFAEDTAVFATAVGKD